MEEVRSLGGFSRSTCITHKDIANVKHYHMKINKEEFDPPEIQSPDNELEDIIKEVAMEGSLEEYSQLKKDKIITTMNEIITLLDSQNFPIANLDILQKQQSRAKATLKAALMQIPSSSKTSTNSNPGKRKIIITKISLDKRKKAKQDHWNDSLGWD